MRYRVRSAARTGLVATVLLSMASLSAAHATASTGGVASTGEVAIAPDAGTTQERARERVLQMSTAERAASVIMGHLPTTDAAAIRDYAASTGVAGFILMGSNVPDTENELRVITGSLAASAELPPLVAIDQEGGDVSRLTWDDFGSALTLKGADDSVVAEAFGGRGALVARAGIDLNFGVVADWTADPGSFIFSRALGTSPTTAAASVAAAVDAEAPYVATTLKHFPGHGAAPGDSHHLIPETDMSLEAWRGSEAEPFRAGIDAGAPFVMFGHLAYTSVDPLPASLSREWHRILREELGFDGVTVTDDMAMLEASGVADYADPVRNAVMALDAGNDLILGVSYTSVAAVTDVVNGIVAAVEDGTLAEERLADAATRVTAARMVAVGTVGVALPCADCAAF